MDKIIRHIFETYINLDVYQDRIRDNPDYTQANKDIEKKEEKILKIIETIQDKDYAVKTINELFDANMELSNVYRYHDFSFGFMTGIIIGMQMKNPETNMFIKHCKDYLSTNVSLEF